MMVKNCRLALAEAGVDYAVFGRGEAPLVLIPGLGDGLATVRGRAAALAWAYRALGRARTVYVFSRRDPLPSRWTTRDMARDLAGALEALALPPADVVGVSQGGMIAQYLALDAPARVRRLALAVTAAGPTAALREAVPAWIALAEAGDHGALMLDTAARAYSEAYWRARRWLAPLLRRVGKPRSYDRFLTQARACLSHDARDRLSGIACPTLVLGGGRDRVVGPDAAGELAAAIPGSRLHVYPALGHAAYEEAPDFQRRILQFFTEELP